MANLTVERFKGAWAVFDGDVVLHRALDEEEAGRMRDLLSAQGARASGPHHVPRPGIDTAQGNLLRMPRPAPKEPASSTPEKPKAAPKTKSKTSTGAKRKTNVRRAKRGRTAGF